MRQLRALVIDLLFLSLLALFAFAAVMIGGEFNAALDDFANHHPEDQ